MSVAAGGAASWKPAVLLAGSLIAVAAAAALVPIFAARESSPPAAGPFVAPAAAFRLSDVVDVDPQGAVLSDRSLDLGGATLARAVPLSPGDLRPGEVIVVIGRPNEVRNYAILLLAVTTGDGRGQEPPRVFAAFRGHEPFGDEAAPVAWGTITDVEGGRVVLEGPGGPMELTLGDGAPLVRFAPVEPWALVPGDRVAAVADSAGRATVAIALPAQYLPREP